jgi:hypothetical protein
MFVAAQTETPDSIKVHHNAANCQQGNIFYLFQRITIVIALGFHRYCEVLAMKNLFEKQWEQYSDELSTLLDEISTSENLSRNAVEAIHLASVKLFHDSLKNMLEDQASADPQFSGLTHPAVRSRLH